jgi:predicted RNA-binding protein (virulence factor B family)
MMGARLRPGGEYILRAVRESALGVFLDAGSGNTSDDILLHKAQQTRPVAVGEEILVNLYLDPKKRLAASMRLARVKEGEVGLASVLSVTEEGGFLDIGAERGVFLPFKEMRGRIRPGQLFYVKIYRDKSDRLAASMAVEEDIKKTAASAADKRRGDGFTGRVYGELADCWLLWDEREKTLAFLYRGECRKQPEIGEEISGRVTFIRSDGRLNITQRAPKQDALADDAEKIWEYLTASGGRMPYGDDTLPSVIKERFSLSKAAFKRALGRLMKEGRIRQEDGWTVQRQDLYARDS